MQASLKLNTRNSEYVIVTVSKDPKKQSPEEKTFKLSQEPIHNAQLAQSIISQTQHFSHVNYEIQPNFYSQEIKECKTCKCWKLWAIKQEQNLIKMEADLITKQKLLRDMVHAMQLQITQKNAKIEESARLLQKYLCQIKQLQLKIKKIQSQLSKKQSKKDLELNDNYTQMSQRQSKISKFVDKQTQISFIQSKMTTFVDQEFFETPKKFHQEYQPLSAPYKIQLKQIQDSPQNNLLNSTKKYPKNSNIVNKADGWMSTQSKFMETTEKYMTPLNQFELRANFNKSQGTTTNTDKTLFQNQILKDYNSTLVERLRASKLRKYI